MRRAIKMYQKGVTEQLKLCKNSKNLEGYMDFALILKQDPAVQYSLVRKIIILDRFHIILFRNYTHFITYVQFFAKIASFRVWHKLC